MQKLLSMFVSGLFVITYVFIIIILMMIFSNSYGVIPDLHLAFSHLNFLTAIAIVAVSFVVIAWLFEFLLSGVIDQIKRAARVSQVIGYSLLLIACIALALLRPHIGDYTTFMIIFSVGISFASGVAIRIAYDWVREPPGLLLRSAIRPANRSEADLQVINVNTPTFGAKQ